MKEKEKKREIRVKNDTNVPFVFILCCMMPLAFLEHLEQ